MAEVLVKIDVPKDWRRFKLPRALDSRLQELLDRQDRDGKLSTVERREAKALAELVDMLSFMKRRAQEIPHSRSNKRTSAKLIKPSKTKVSSPLRESDLGKTLRRIRERHIAKGGKLLSIEEIDREVAERRGERPS